MAALVDTNILVYRFDPTSPRKQAIATKLLRQGLVDGSLRIPHQALVEVIAAATRPRTGNKAPPLSLAEAYREAEEWLVQFIVLYPHESLLRTAMRGAAAYQLSWYDGHTWAYAECYGLSEMLSEDFQPHRP